MISTKRMRVLALLMISAGIAGAQRPKTTRVIAQTSAEQTRQTLTQMLAQHPPSLRSVLALDPSLLTNKSYLEPYPELASFLNEHPEVTHNPSFYIGNPDLRRYGNMDLSPSKTIPERTLDFTRDMLAGLAVITGLGIVAALIIWLIRTFLDYRRWTRLTRIQTEVHTKLMDRLTANEELLAYVQSAAGQKFLESAPISLEEAPRRIGAPMGRILLSVQAGIVAIAAGIGLQLVSWHFLVEVQQSVQVFGILAVTLGIGFLLAAGASYLISWKLGLVETPKSE